ncbi:MULTISPECIES: DUF2375 family protein [unclassified Agarivorans]|uniref:DUF2375 family protein n=1 Tax=unclassified Agarivorans TaxID=2636026 RepID=UPI0010F13CFE|nr:MULTISPECIES: DUF2375 family protein [unclassified Agarivorans]MDO6685168.1 DUF2375 family protein [Agarivorans sp. 3_MG-2023]MDO6715660.1 DUF2375 family protein [Agarivorans sp. 2_MG-2023]MDO6763811.1 DUF2375 family protein [Agarivorans sp. 1_MG-2023]GDY27074.1 hypothetical protein AHAT_29640 [Agarivorans sp. Toyoura001]
MNTPSVSLSEVTLLFYPEDKPYQLQSLVLKDQVKTQQGRVMISAKYKQGKIIVAVIEGHAELLNLLGDRFDGRPASAA